MPFISDNIESEGYITGATISATSIFISGVNLSSTDVRVTGGTYSQSTNNLLFTNNTGGTFTVTGVSTNLDVQSVFTATSITTTATLIDVSGMTLTTKNLGSSATTYQILFTAQISNNNNFGNSSFRIVKNGSLINGSFRNLTNAGASLKDAKRDLSISCSTTGVTSGDIIKVQFSASTGTVTVADRTLSIIGILNSKIV